jgi:hypothetical protein
LCRSTSVHSTGIAFLTITGDTLGGSFVLDDLTVDATVPEPSTLMLFLTAGLIYFVHHRLSHRRAGNLALTPDGSPVCRPWFGA